LAYCIGHGCFVKLDHLGRVGGFPTISPTDDLALGYQATVLGAEICPIPMLDYCEVAPNPMMSMKQSRFWFLGSARFWRDLRHARQVFHPEVSQAQWLALHVSGVARNAAWAGRGLVWLVALALALATRQQRMAWALVLAHVLYVQGGYVMTLYALRRLPGAPEHTELLAVRPGTVVVGGLASSGSFVLRSLGPFSGSMEFRRAKASNSGWKHER
jgi:hypothetical protein